MRVFSLSDLPRKYETAVKWCRYIREQLCCRNKTEIIEAVAPDG